VIGWIGATSAAWTALLWVGISLGLVLVALYDAATAASIRIAYGSVNTPGASEYDSWATASAIEAALAFLVAGAVLLKPGTVVFLISIVGSLLAAGAAIWFQFDTAPVVTSDPVGPFKLTAIEIGLPMAILSLLCLVTSTYAWITTSPEPPITPHMPPPTHQA
jgi:uncharacterized membrane protein YhdT